MSGRVSDNQSNGRKWIAGTGGPCVSCSREDYIVVTSGYGIYHRNMNATYDLSVGR